MLRWLLDLWAGRMRLSRAFWGYAVLGGILVNVYATFAAFAVVAAGGSAALALFFHLSALPWIALTLVGVWRSAGAADVPRERAALARTGIVLWSMLLAVI
jgi:hypothetical protein